MMEGLWQEHGSEGPIHCIFFSQFHPQAGPKIVYQYPENFITKEIFDAVSVYIIPKPQIQKRIITVNVLNHKITGYPNEIKNPKYPRNALLFNVCFVCHPNSRTVQFEPEVKKLSEFFENLELESGFLCNEESRKQIPGIMKTILEDLNFSGKCKIEIDINEEKFKPEPIEHSKQPKKLLERRQSLFSDRRQLLDSEDKIGQAEHTERRMSMSLSALRLSRKPSDPDKRAKRALVDSLTSSISKIKGPNTSVLHLKVVKILPDPEDVLDYHVPVLVSEDILSQSDLRWDLTTQQVIPHIDGFSHVAKIAAQADVDGNLVKLCVKNLLYYNLVKLLPIFQYSNVYTVTPEIRTLYNEREKQEECRRFVAKTENYLPTLTDILMLFCSMTYGVSVRDLCIRFNPQSLNIDERKLVQFGLLYNIIRRLNQYPVLSPTDTFNIPSIQSNSSSVQSNVQDALYDMSDGLHSIDEICCKLGLTYKEVYERLEKDNDILIIWK